MSEPASGVGAPGPAPRTAGLAPPSGFDPAQEENKAGSAAGGLPESDRKRKRMDSSEERSAEGTGDASVKAEADGVNPQAAEGASKKQITNWALQSDGDVEVAPPGVKDEGAGSYNPLGASGLDWSTSAFVKSELRNAVSGGGGPGAGELGSSSGGGLGLGFTSGGGLGASSSSSSSMEDCDSPAERAAAFGRQVSTSSAPAAAAGDDAGNSSSGSGGGGGAGGGFAARMMKRMGFVAGKGLGAGGAGMSEPLAADQARNATIAGLGYAIAVTAKEHAYSEANVEIKMSVDYVPNPSATSSSSSAGGIGTLSSSSTSSSATDSSALLPTLPLLPEEIASATIIPPQSAVFQLAGGAKSSLDSTVTDHPWCTLGRATMDYLDYSFCDEDIEDANFAAKTFFDTVEEKAFLQARDRANPFEKIKKEMFQNRAALKMAEMDSQTGRIFTRPPCLGVPVVPHPEYAHLIPDISEDPMFVKTSAASSSSAGGTAAGAAEGPKLRELLYFGDVCAGPGGFTEYMLTVLKWRAKGQLLPASCFSSFPRRLSIVALILSTSPFQLLLPLSPLSSLPVFSVWLHSAREDRLPARQVQRQRPAALVQGLLRARQHRRHHHRS